jgi:hypothetical protein
MKGKARRTKYEGETHKKEIKILTKGKKIEGRCGEAKREKVEETYRKSEIGKL